MSSTKTATSAQVSTGAGIAIAGVWFAGAATTITILLIFFVFATPVNYDDIDAGFLGIMLAVLGFGAPLIAAYSATKMILGRDN